MTAIAAGTPFDAGVWEIRSWALNAPYSDTSAGVPCAARPATGFRHLDGPCQCFFGGPPPTFPASPNLGPQA